MEQKAGAQIGRRAFIQSIVILFVLMMVAGILTLVIPAGQYTRIEVDGRETIDPASFQLVEKPNYPIWHWFLAPIEVLGSESGLTVIVIIGFYYGGTTYQEGTSVAMQLYRRALEEYQSVIQIDMHTGYGPRDQMSIIMSPLDPMTSEETSRKFNYPLVLKINAQEFYDISGDMAEYYYKLRNERFPDKHLFACGFEFGTFGSSPPARIRSLRAMVFENQLHWHGAKSKKAAQQIRKEFEELYFPSETKWREKALADGRQAFDGMLRAYQLI